MQNLLSKKKINQFQKDGAVFIKGKFDKSWIEKLRMGNIQFQLKMMC